MRRHWSLSENGKGAEFTVGAYYGDPGYTEDGTMGNYVAIDVEPFFWYHDDDIGTIGVSMEKVSDLWEYHPVCLDSEGNPRAHTYIPAYELALDKEGLPVSLTGYYPPFRNLFQPSPRRAEILKRRCRQVRCS